MLRMIFVLATGLWLTACGDNQHAPDDVTPTPDAAPDAAPGVRGACLDRPTDLPRPPVAGEPLACDLLPPGFVPR
jgi:hypothetical protein